MSKLTKAIEFIKVLEQQFPEHTFLLVGGAVRDIIMRVEPNDFDIATNASIDMIEDQFATANIGASRSFGIVSVQFDGELYEVAEFRTESNYKDSRHPDQVSKATTFEIDSKRRDFTINSLGYNSKGQIVDFHNGTEDINNKVIRTVGNPLERFEEDPLRVLRLFRFMSTLNFKVGLDTSLAAQSVINSGPLAVSIERVQNELYKAARSGKSLRTFIEILDEYNLLECYLPEILNLKGLPQSHLHHPEGDCYVHTLCAVSASRSVDPVVNLAILFHDIGKGVTYKLRDGYKHTYYGHETKGLKLIDRVVDRLKISSNDATAFKFGAYRHMLMHHPQKLTKSKIVALVNDPNWFTLREVGYADEMSRGEPPEDALEGVSYANEIDYIDNIAYMIEVTDNANNGKGSDELKNRINKCVNGNKLMQHYPILDQHRELIGDVIKDVRQWIINNNKYDADESEIDKEIQRAISRYVK